MQIVRYFFSDLNQIWSFATDFNSFSPKSNFTEICPVGAALIHADGRTDMTKPTGAFREYANTPQSACIFQWVNDPLVFTTKKYASVLAEFNV